MKKKEQTAGIETGSHKNAIEYSEHVVVGARQGHGFAAEKANHLIDNVKGKDARIVGGDNARNGPDRLVDGIYIQSKYCRSASDSVMACFDKESGRFNYLNPDGSCMSVEVPSDQYPEAINKMQEMIRIGRVPGVTNPNDAEKIVREGSVTYNQAKNIAKAGTIESLTYDSATGAIGAAAAFGVSALVAFARGVWAGEETKLALKEACKTGFYIGGVTVVSHVLSQQLIKAGADRAMKDVGTFAVDRIGSKGAALIAKAAGYNVSGGAAKQVASKIIRGHVVVGVVTTVVLSSADIARMFRGKISGKQLFKNVANTAASVAGGTAGWLGGAALGAKYGSIVPGWGTLIGGVVGGLVGGGIASFGAAKVLDEFIEDDADEMLGILQERLAIFAHDYLLVESEVEGVVDVMSENQREMIDLLQRMFESSNREYVADQFLLPLVNNQTRKRLVIDKSSSERYVLFKNKVVRGLKIISGKISSSRFYLRDGRIKRKMLEPLSSKLDGLRYYKASPSGMDYVEAIEGVFEEVVEEDARAEVIHR